MALNPRQMRFVEGYLAGKTAEQAYRDAGYVSAGGAARSNASRLMTNENVRAAIAAARREAALRAELSAEWVLSGLKAEALERGDGASHSARVRALELIGKQFGLFKDAVEVSGPGGGPVRYDLSKLSDDEFRRLDDLLAAAEAPDPADPGPPGGRAGEA